MTWNERLLTEAELQPFLKDANDRRFVAWVDALIAEQHEAWPALRDGYEMFQQIATKRVPVGDTEVVIQHNPRRIRSTAAAVDKTSVGERPCFLCAANLPPEEKGIPYGDDLIFLCNPFPVLDRHLTITHRQHIEQKIAGNVELLIAMAGDLAPDYFVLYNGPQCGASAPDHLHFQACSRRLLPIEQEIAAGEPLNPAHCDICEEQRRNQFELFTLEGCGRSVIVLRGNDPREIAHWFYRTVEEMPRADDQSEPLMNLVCTFDRDTFTLYVFPRLRHRPASFFAQGDARLIVSPGAIDMAGVVVVPERAHFLKLDGATMEAIFAEVSLSDAAVNEMLDRVSSEEADR